MLTTLLCADLAVIFRPGMMSHPTHELMPGEHQLSQQELEFLIAHQDWFMLDAPTKRKATQTGSDVEIGISSSDDETGGAWKLIDNPARLTEEDARADPGAGGAKVSRRRTTTERDARPATDGEPSSPPRPQP